MFAKGCRQIPRPVRARRADGPGRPLRRWKSRMIAQPGTGARVRAQWWWSFQSLRARRQGRACDGGGWRPAWPPGAAGRSEPSSRRADAPWCAVGRCLAQADPKSCGIAWNIPASGIWAKRHCGPGLLVPNDPVRVACKWKFYGSSSAIGEGGSPTSQPNKPRSARFRGLWAA